MKLFSVQYIAVSSKQKGWSENWSLKQITSQRQANFSQIIINYEKVYTAWLPYCQSFFGHSYVFVMKWKHSLSGEAKSIRSNFCFDYKKDQNNFCLFYMNRMTHSYNVEAWAHSPPRAPLEWKETVPKNPTELPFISRSWCRTASQWIITKTINIKQPLSWGAGHMSCSLLPFQPRQDWSLQFS